MSNEEQTISTINFKFVSEYDILCQHLPKNHTKTEFKSKAEADFKVLEIQARGYDKAACALNPYGGFTVFKW